MAEPTEEKNTSGLKILASFGPFFKPYRRELITWFFIFGTYFLVGILTPLAWGYYIDHVFPSKSLRTLWLFVGLYGVYAVGLHILQFFGNRGTAKIIERVVAELRARVYEKLHRL